MNSSRWSSARWRLDEQEPVDEQSQVEAGGGRRWMNSSPWRLERGSRRWMNSSPWSPVLRYAWYVHFSSCLPTVIYNVFMHNNAFWSNSNAFSLIIYTKRENTGSWNSGPEKATSGHLFCTTSNEMKLYGEFYGIYKKYWSQ